MGNDVSEMLQQVMDNPQFAALVRSLREGAPSGGEGGGIQPPPNLTEKLPELMAMLGPMMGQPVRDRGGTPEAGEESVPAMEGEDSPRPAENREGDGDGKARAAAEGIGGTVPPIGTLFQPGSREKRNKLLLALKPYLSPARCDIVDRAMSVMQMGELFGTIHPGNSRK